MGALTRIGRCGHGSSPREIAIAGDERVCLSVQSALPTIASLTTGWNGGLRGWWDARSTVFGLWTDVTVAMQSVNRIEVMRRLVILPTALNVVLICAAQGASPWTARR